MDVSRLEEALTPKTKMVMAVSILGNPCELEVMKAFCDKHNLYLFEDNCESLGAVSASGKLCGTYGIVNTYSTFFSHHISTMEGGLTLTDNRELADIMLSLRSHGWTRHLPKDTTIYEKGDNEFFEAYRFILPGYNVRPGELNGAIGLEQLKKVDSFLETRRKNAAIWKSLMEGDERFIIQREVGQSSWFNFTVILNPEMNLDREKIMQRLGEHGIPFRIITGGNFLRHDVAKYADYTTVGEMKNADIAHDQGFFVGNHIYDLSDQLQQFREVLDKAAR
jgi:CDP-6-deoxy-D-xylo-4-hexulose-3-dehydrase